MNSQLSRFTRLLPIFVVAVFCLSSQSALASYSPDNAVKKDPLGGQKSLQGVSVGEFTGAAVYEYPISVPPGRNGLTPAISLTYNSQDNSFDNIAGYRWSLTQYSISRLNERGVEKLYELNDFTASLPFESGELTEVSLSDGSHGQYGQRFESSFATYEYLPDDSWQVTDRQGNRYIFGKSASAREFDPADPARVSQWMLEEIRDPNDNFIRFTFQRLDSRLYPSEIFYTGHGIEDGIFRIKFLLTAAQRPDSHFSYGNGYRQDTNYLVEGIQMYQYDYLRHQYDLSYEAVSPHVLQTIKSITQTAYDQSGTATTLPPTTFGYSQSEIGWQESADYLPDWVFENCNEGAGTCETPKVYQWDMNGDGLVDFEYLLDNVTFTRAINDGKGGWIKVPASFFTSYFSPRVPSLAHKALDFDGDAKTEIISHLSHPLDVELVKGQQAAKQDNGASIADLNGDGFPDIIQKRSFFGGNGPDFIESSQCLNDGGLGCFSSDLWESPEVLITDTDFYQYPRTSYVQDCNYDGLADVRYAGSGARDWINDGKGGWILNPAGTCHFSQIDSLTRRSADVNGDGLIDSITAEKETLPVGHKITNEVRLNKGDGNTASPIKNKFPLVLGNVGNGFFSDSGVRILDLNGDKLPDIMQSNQFYDGKGNTTFTKKVYLSTGSRPYFLKTVHTSTGGEINLEYQTSAQYFRSDGTQGNPDLPIIVDTVSRMTVDDGMGNISSTDYFYEDGHYYFENAYDKAFAGFRLVTKTDGLGYKSKTYYHQGQYSVDGSANGEHADHISKKGRAYRNEVYDKGGQLLSVTINRFEHKALGLDRFFPHRSQTLSQTFDGGITKSTAKQFSYDEIANLIQITDFGEVIASGQNSSFSDTGNDLLKTQNSFVPQRAFPYEKQVWGQSGQLLSHARSYYDGLGLGQVNIGNVTAQESWLDSSGSWIRSETQYNEYGLPIVSSNPRGFSMTTSYDADNLYPATITNALGQYVDYIYDSNIGQITSVTGPNGSTTNTTYDGLGRAIRVEKDGQLLSTTSYNDFSTPRSVHQVAYNDDGEKIDSFTYLDALGRAIQSKQEAPKGKWITTQTIYDERGKVEKQIQPYFSSSSAFESLNEGKLGSEFTYDGLGRVLTSTNPLGITSNSYSGWEVTGTDLNGNQKTQAHDARGSLIRVDERNAGQTHSTHYSYDPLGRLLQIRDAENNTRNFAYDSLGRRTFQSKLGSSAGWSYVYDQNGNLIQRADLKNQVINYSYDELDRLLTENDLSFAYDQGVNGIGRLSKVHRPGYERTYGYDLWGRVTSEHKQIADQSFDFAYAYDQLGAVTSLSYPDGSVAHYTYDPAHQLDSVKVGGKLYAHQFDYNPAGQVTSMKLGNGVIINNNYDENQLYRLMAKTATGGLQDYSYTYDPVGNLTTLIDANTGITAKTVSYEYDDLYRLTKADYLNDLTQSYEYDALGNMIYKSDVGQMSYSGPHPHALTEAGSHSYDYDANGNMTARDTDQMTYDDHDRLIESVGKAKFTYGEGYDRLTKTDVVTGGITYYPDKYFELHPEKEVKYIYAGSQRIAKIEKELNAPAPSPDPTPDPQPDPDPSPDPTPDPTPTPAPTPAPAQPTPVVSEQGTGGSGGGSYGSQDELKLMRLISDGKETEARELSNKIYLYTLNSLEKDKQQTLVAGALPESAFENLKVTYTRNSALMIWDAMPPDVAKFKIYRSKGNQATALDDAEILVGELKASRFKNRFLHRLPEAGDRYAYKIVAYDKAGKKLVSSFKLHANQIFVYEGQRKIVDFRNFTRTNFTHVRIKSNEFVDGQSTSIPQRLLLRPDAALKNGARLAVNFLNCTKKQDGSSYCQKTDSQFVELYVLNRSKAVKKTLAFIQTQVQRLASALVPNAYAEAADENVYYLLTDHLGSIDVVLDEDANIVERRDFLPYGSERLSESVSEATETDHKFTGKELDDETGLHYYGARYYDSEIGRFVSVDPWEGRTYDPQSLNKYAYVQNNPVKYVDPSGAKLEDFWFNSPTNGSSYSYGEEFGVYKGVSVRSGESLTADVRNEYQCTNLAKNFALSEYDVNLGGLGNGDAYGTQAAYDNAPLANNTNSPDYMYISYSNGGMNMPQEDDLISWSGGDYGHVGVVAEVVFDEKLGTGTVYTLEQNFKPNQGLFVQGLNRTYDESGDAVYNVAGRGGYEVLGWARYSNQSSAQPHYTSTPYTPATGLPMSYDKSKSQSKEFLGQ